MKIETLLIELSPLIMKITIVVLFYLFLNYVLKKKPHKALKILKNIAIILIFRDVLFAVLSSLYNQGDAFRYDLILLITITDIIIIVIYIFWIRSYTKQGLPLIIIIFNILIAAFFIMNIWNPILKETSTFLKRFAVWGWVLINQIVLATNLFRVTPFNTKSPELILETKWIFFISNLVLGIFMYVTFWENSNQEEILQTSVHIIFHTVLIPISYMIHLYIIIKYNQFNDEKKDNEITFIQKDLDSMFEFMQVISTAMADKLSLDEILKYVIASTVKITGAEAGAILMIDDYEDILKVKAVSGFFPPLYSVPNFVKTKISSLEAYFQSTPIRIGETILGEAVSSGEPVFIKNSFNDPRMKVNTLNDTLFVSSVIIMPLVISKRVLGALAIINRERGKLFNNFDFEHLKTFSQYASLIIDFLLTYMELLEKKEMEREIGIAAGIQQQFLPKKLPRLQNSVLEAFSIPAKGVSGDYYDILPLKGNKTALVICDVAGKGVPAALVMVMVRTILHLITSPDREVATLLTWINKGISGQIDIDHYATMSLLFYDQITNELTYSNAAHHPLLIYRKKTKTIETMDTEGLPIGIERTTKYGQKKTRLNTGDMIVMYTDGIIEAMNNKYEQYSVERFTELIINNADLTPKEIIKTIKKDISAFVGNANQHDDQTLLLMKVD